MEEGREDKEYKELTGVRKGRMVYVTSERWGHKCTYLLRSGKGTLLERQIKGGVNHRRGRPSETIVSGDRGYT